MQTVTLNGTALKKVTIEAADDNAPCVVVVDDITRVEAPLHQANSAPHSRPDLGGSLARHEHRGWLRV